MISPSPLHNIQCRTEQLRMANPTAATVAETFAAVTLEPDVALTELCGMFPAAPAGELEVRA
jgi:hypothetical protein